MSGMNTKSKKPQGDKIVRAIQRAIYKQIEIDGDRCSSCHRHFLRNDMTFGRCRGRVALVGKCCRMEIRYVLQRVVLEARGIMRKNRVL
jgi:hypothetical protein